MNLLLLYRRGQLFKKILLFFPDSDFSDRVLPTGITGLQRRTSRTVARKYGRLSRSLNVGMRDRPMIASSSSWHFFCFSGKAIIANMNHVMALAVYRLHGRAN